jgi:hypothetical protein
MDAAPSRRGIRMGEAAKERLAVGFFAKKQLIATNARDPSKTHGRCEVPKKRVRVVLSA